MYGTPISCGYPMEEYGPSAFRRPKPMYPRYCQTQSALTRSAIYNNLTPVAPVDGFTQRARLTGVTGSTSYSHHSSFANHSPRTLSAFARGMQPQPHSLSPIHYGTENSGPKKPRILQDGPLGPYSPTVYTSFRTAGALSRFNYLGSHPSVSLPRSQTLTRFSLPVRTAISAPILRPNTPWTTLFQGARPSSVVSSVNSSIYSTSTSLHSTAVGTQLLSAKTSMPGLSSDLRPTSSTAASEFKPNTQQLISPQSEPQKNSGKLEVGCSPLFKHEPRKRKMQPVSGSFAPTAVPVSDSNQETSVTVSDPVSGCDGQRSRSTDSVSTSSGPHHSSVLLDSASASRCSDTLKSMSTYGDQVVAPQCIPSLSSSQATSPHFPPGFQNAHGSANRFVFQNPLRRPNNSSLLPILPKTASYLSTRPFGVGRPISVFLEPHLQAVGARRSLNPPMTCTLPGTDVLSNPSPHLTHSMDDRPKFGADLKLFLVEPIFPMSSSEDYLWGRKFFGQSNPQQLIYTLIHVVSRVLGLRTGQQLRYGLSGQLHFVVLPTSAIPDKHLAATMENFGKEYTGPVRLIDADIFHLDYEWILRCSQVRLLYVPHLDPPLLDTGESPEFSVQEFGQSEVSSTRPQIVPRNLSDPLTGQSVRSRLARTKKAPTNFGYLFGHFPANNHACCLTCLHAFYLSKRPKWSSSRGHKDDAYFLTWHSNTTEPFWFHHRPVGAACLSEILRTILTALNWAELAPKDLGLCTTELNASYGLFERISQKNRAWVWGTHTATHAHSDLRKDTEDDNEDTPTGPLNLVMKECAPESKMKHSHLLPALRPSETHPTCLDYWPELTERARQSPWQCTDCKTCTVCQNKQITTDLLVCDACDKGFHIECHVPKLEEPVDRSLPWVCAECQKEGYSVAIGTLPGESDSKYEDSANFGTEEGGSLHHNEDEARCSQDENEINEESQLSETGNLRSSKVEDLREDQELALKGEVRTLDRGAEVISPSTSPTPTHNYLSESNRLATPDSTVQSVSPAPEAPVMRQHTPQERCSSSDGQRSTPRQRRDSSSSEQSRTPDTGNCSRLDPNVKHLEQLTHTNTDESSAVRDQTTMDAYDTGDTGREFSQDTAQYRPPDVRAWSVEHVREWLLEEGFPREAEAFCQQEIDGACLLLMKRMDVLTELGIKLGPAVKIYERIKRLQSGCTSPTLLSA